MICTWSGSTTRRESKDHVFPRELGGKLDANLWVYDCERGRASISKAEDEVVHRSHLSVYRFASGLLPRHKERPSSGLIEPRINLVKDPAINRYSVFSLRTGISHPHTSPALEVNLASGGLYFHGSGPEDAQRLLSCASLMAPACTTTPAACPETPAGHRKSPMGVSVPPSLLCVLP
jgi:hypothetical protein